MRVLLTGAFGAIGFRVVEALLAAGHDVVALDLDTPANRRSARAFAGRIAVRWGDVTDAAAVAEAVRGVDAVIHNAAILPPRTEADPELAERVNVGGTRTVLAAIRECAPMPRLVYPSSVSVHGHHRPDSPTPCRVADPLRAEDAYAGHKIECEQLIAAADVDWVIVRIGACLEGRRAGSVDTALLRMMFTIDPRCRIEYVHPRDVATAMVNALVAPDAVRRTFLLGGGASCQTTWGDFTGLTFEALGCGRLPTEAYGTQGYYTDWMDTAESERVLRFQRHTLDDYRAELRRQFRWLRRLLVPFRGLVRRQLLAYSPTWRR
ncbi:MAG: NAD(P)-dependent oxidoreductase [Candidatus Binatia bacterium]